MSETVQHVKRVLDAEEASALVGTMVTDPFEPTLRSPRDGDVLRVLDDEDNTVALITRLPPDQRAALRRFVTSQSYDHGVARQGRGMSTRGATFGYAPPKVLARQEGCRMTAFSRDHPDGTTLLNRIAGGLAAEFDRLLPDQAAHDRATVGESILSEWRMGESSWTSGVINKANWLPYHRDGNNLKTWSAMPTLRYGMNGGRLHVPEYGMVLPCGDGDVTWFYGRGLVHGVTPMVEAKPDAYRFSLVYYALRGMTNCATYAEETKRVAERRTVRERAEVNRIRGIVGLTEPAEVKDEATIADLVEFARIEQDSGDIEPWAEILTWLYREGHVNREEVLWLVYLYNTYDSLGSAWAMFRRWSSPHAWAVADDADDAADGAAFPIMRERRNLFGGRVLKRHESYVDNLGGRSQYEWILAGVDPAATPEANFQNLMAHTRKVWGVGRQAAFEWVEFIEKVLGLDVTAPDAELWESEGPRRSLQRMYGNLTPDLKWLNDRADECRATLDAAGVKLPWEDFETVICDFNVMRDGRYYPGQHLAALKEEILEQEGDDRALLLRGFAAIVPDEWADIPPGINKANRLVYKQTREILRTP